MKIKYKKSYRFYHESEQESETFVELEHVYIGPVEY